MSNNIGIDLGQYQSIIEPDNITIEITGLKSFGTFIGLEDTPLYYDNGKFFKVENNKIVYTDIEWKDISGDISDQPELQKLIEQSVEKSQKDIVIQYIDEHNNNNKAHQFIQNLINTNYEELDYRINENFENIQNLDEKIDGINSNLTQKIEKVESDVTEKYNNLVQDIDELSGIVEENYTTLDSKIDTTKTELQGNIDTLAETVQQHYTDLTQDINDLVDTVNDNYTNLDTKITSTNTRITEVAEEINQTIEENVTTLQQADAGLQAQITTNKNDIADLTQVVQDDYNELDTAIKSEETRAKGVETSLQQQITTEITNRENADANLQEQIDAITSSSDVKDIVGTYAELQNYDKTTLGNNDIIKVLKDETKDDASTYYKYVLSSQSFQYIGAEGPFYTKSETDNKFVPQTRTINNKSLNDNISLTYTDVNALPNTTFIPINVTDLDDNTNYTKYSDFTDSNSVDFTINTNTVNANVKISQDAENIISITTDGILAKHQNISHLATKDELTNGLNTKQNTLTSENAGEGIKIENGIISNTRTSAEWGNITGTLSEQEDLQNVLNDKQNIVDNSLVTLAKTVPDAINELDSKIRDIQLFKFPDATIIGNPIMNNGQVSNFSSQNYLILPFAFDTKDRAFEINMAFTTGANVSTTQNLLGGNYCIALLIEGGKLAFKSSNNGTNWNVANITTSLNLQPNTNYFVRIEFSKLDYKILYSTNGEDYEQIGYLVSTLFPRHGQIFIGIGNNQFNPFQGIINLNKTYIKLNNSIIWQGMDDAGLATRADISLSNLDEIGQSKFDMKQNVTDVNLQTSDKTIVGAINELNTKSSGLPIYIEDTETLKFGGN